MLTSGSRPNTSTLGTTTPICAPSVIPSGIARRTESCEPLRERRPDGADPGGRADRHPEPDRPHEERVDQHQPQHRDREQSHRRPFATGRVRRGRERGHRSGAHDRRFETRQRHEPRDRPRPSRPSAGPGAAARGAARTRRGETRRSARTRPSGATDPLARKRSIMSAGWSRSSPITRPRNSASLGCGHPRGAALDHAAHPIRRARQRAAGMRRRTPSRDRTRRRRAARRPGGRDRRRALAGYRSPTTSSPARQLRTRPCWARPRHHTSKRSPSMATTSRVPDPYVCGSTTSRTQPSYGPNRSGVSPFQACSARTPPTVVRPTTRTAIHHERDHRPMRAAATTTEQHGRPDRGRPHGAHRRRGDADHRRHRAPRWRATSTGRRRQGARSAPHRHRTLSTVVDSYAPSLPPRSHATVERPVGPVRGGA